MNASENLWVVGYDELAQAEKARDELVRLHDKQFLFLLDVAVVSRLPDGSLQIGRPPTRPVAGVGGSTLVGFLAGALLLQPLAGAAIGALVGGAFAAVAAQTGIDDAFIHEVRDLMKPGTAALFVLGSAADLEVVQHCIRGLGGKILKTNVDLERVKLIQASLDTGKAGQPGIPPTPPTRASKG